MKAVILILLSLSTFAQVRTKVNYVIDGDTFDTYVNGKKTRVRVSGIDCPEVYNKYSKKPSQDYGEKAKANIAELIQGKTVVLNGTDYDFYGRLLSGVKIEGRDLGYIAVSRGWCWSLGRAYVEQQKEAEKRDRGLWSLPNPIRPSKYRVK